MTKSLSWLPSFDTIFVPAKSTSQFVISADTLREIGKESDGCIWGCIKRGLEEGLLVGSDPIEPDKLFIVASDTSSPPDGNIGWITLAILRRD